MLLKPHHQGTDPNTHDTEPCRLPTYNPDHELVGGIVSPHQQGVVDDEVTGEEVGVAVDGGSEDGLAVGADVQRVVVDQLQKVLVQQNHLAAFLPRVRLHVAVSQRSFEVEHLHGETSQLRTAQQICTAITDFTEDGFIVMMLSCLVSGIFLLPGALTLWSLVVPVRLPGNQVKAP